MKIIRDLFGLCKHNWKFVKEIGGRYGVVHVLQCKKCGFRKSIRVW